MSEDTLLPSIAVSRAMLATAPGRKKLDLILSSADPRAFVRRLPAEDLYFAIREIGLSDSVELIGLASPSQFRSFVDMDVWEEATPDASQILMWLDMAREGATHTGEMRQKRHALDKELVLLVLKTLTIVHPLEEGVDPVLESNNYVTTAERKYLVEITAEGEDGVAARQVIEDFIDEHPFEATRLFEASRWEMKSELEETAFRWRTGRMRDMGFPSFEEAIRIWTPLPAGWKSREEAPEIGIISGVPALLLIASGPLLLDRVVEQLPDSARPLFNEGLVYLLNCAIVADGIAPKNIDRARQTLAAARAQLSLGLELASGGDEARALAIVATTPPVELFRFAVGHLTALNRKAHAVAKTVTLGQVARTILDSPDEEILVGLRKKRPRLFEPASNEWRGFASRADIDTAEAALRRAEAAGDALAQLGLDAETAAHIADKAGRALTSVTVSQLLVTAALRAPDVLRPLRTSEVAELCGLFESGRLTDTGRMRFVSFFEALRSRVPEGSREALNAIASAATKRFEDEVGPPCAARAIDARFIESVLVEPGV